MPFLTSEDGNPILQDNSGYTYVKHRTTTNRISWRCQLYRSGQCRVTVQTHINSITIIETNINHPHPAIPAEIKNLEINLVIATRSTDSTESTGNIIMRTFGGVDAITVANTVIPNLKRRIQRIRNINHEDPANVTLLSDLVFPDYTRMIKLFGN